MDLSKDDVLKIIQIIEDSPYDEVRLEVGDFKLHVQKSAAGRPSTPTWTPAASASAAPMRAATEAAEQRLDPAVTPVATNAAPAAAVSVQKAAPEPQAIPSGLNAVRAPMLGTFYRAPAPGEKPFIEIGDRVGPDTIVCLVEVMKLFNSVKAGASGTVVKIQAQNAAMVEYGQPLILIEPDAGSTAGA